MTEHGNTQTWKRSESLEELRKEGNETGTPEEGQEVPQEGQEVQQAEGEDTATEGKQAEAEEGVADDDDDDDDDKLASTVPEEETQAPGKEISPIDEGGEPEAYVDYARLNHSILHLGQQIKILDLDSALKLDDIHKLLLVNYDQLLKSNELLNAIYIGLGPEKVGRQSPPIAKRRGSLVTPGAPIPKRVSSRPPLGAEYREQYNL